MRDTTDAEVQISATTNWRSLRLNTLAYALNDADNNLLRLIDSLSDHKGDLTVVWKVEPTQEERQLVAEGWAALYEAAENVRHVVGEEV